MEALSLLQWIIYPQHYRCCISGNYTLKIDLSDFMDEQRFAQYENFRVGDEQVIK